MNHNVYGRKLSRTKNERRRLFMGLVRDLIIHGHVTTTKAKAKAVQPLIDKLITEAKKGTNASYRNVLKVIDNGPLVKQLIADTKDRFSKRTSGYTRITRVGMRTGDSSEKVMLAFVDEVVPTTVVTPEKREKKVAKKMEQKKEEKGAKVKKKKEEKKKVNK